MNFYRKRFSFTFTTGAFENSKRVFPSSVADMIRIFRSPVELTAHQVRERDPGQCLNSFHEIHQISQGLHF